MLIDINGIKTISYIELIIPQSLLTIKPLKSLILKRLQYDVVEEALS